jgi:ribosome-associated toxin RatA of RatAB toxin-antitoxin module
MSLAMEFEFKSGLMGFAAEKLFSSSANNLIDAIMRRAREVYSSE